MSNFDTEIIDLIDLLHYTTSSEFTDKWRFKYSERFIKHFQFRLLKTLKDKKPLKLTTLFSFLRRRCGYQEEEILNFFIDVEIELYSPVITGSIQTQEDSSS